MTRFSFQYLAYISSPAWQARRTRALGRAGFRCQVCGEPKRLQVHHVTYQHLGHERDEDLTVLCWWCHTVVTLWLRTRRVWRWLVNRNKKAAYESGRSGKAWTKYR